MSLPGRLLFGAVEPPARGLAPAVLCGALAGLAVVGQADLLSRAIDRAFLGRGSLAAVAPFIVGLATTAAARALLVWLQEVLAARYSSRVRLALRDRLTRRLLALGPRYASEARSGELANTLVGGIDALDAWLAQYLPQAALAAIVPGIVLAAVFGRDPASGLVLLATLPLAPLFMWLIGSAAQERSRRQWRTLSRLAARFHDALSGLATLRAFGRDAAELRALEAANERHRAATMEVLRLAMVSALALEALATLGTAVVAVEVGLRLLYGRLAFQQAFFVLVLAPELYRPLRALGASFHAGLAGREVAARISEIFAAPGPLAAPEALQPLTRLVSSPARRAGPPPRVRFESVSFAYAAADRPALDAVTLGIEPGTTLALAGASGAGKTTAAHLLLRFLEPDAGRIVVDGVALESLPPEEWRRRVAWVPQRPRLFHGTLRHNLLLGRPDAAEGQIEHCLELAALGELVRLLPAGLETPVGEGGEKLSGGEAQRVALARAFLKDAPVLVLDEPTAQLDLASEAAVVDALARLRRGRTVLLVAHRLTTVAAADRIAVLGQGRVLEQGPPDALASEGVHYKRLLAAWRGAS